MYCQPNSLGKASDVWQVSITFIVVSHDLILPIHSSKYWQIIISNSVILPFQMDSHLLLPPSRQYLFQTHLISSTKTSLRICLQFLRQVGQVGTLTPMMPFMCLMILTITIQAVSLCRFEMKSRQVSLMFPTSQSHSMMENTSLNMCHLVHPQLS